MKEFRKILFELRKENGFTQKQLADILGIRQPSYIRYENGTAEPTQKILIKLADIFDVTTDYLLGRSDDL